MTVLERWTGAVRAALMPRPSSRFDPVGAAFWNGWTATDTTSTTVTEASALKFPAVWAAVQIIAGDVASLPFFHYKRRPDGGKERATSSKLYRVLHDEFNPEMSAFIGRETMTSHVLLWGNAYAEIVRNDLGQVVALWPIEPNRVWPERTDAGQIRYRVTKGDGTQVTVPAERILHIPGLGFNGLYGYSPISLMRGSLGVGLSAEQLGSQVMARGAKYSGFFEHPRTLGAIAHQHLKESIATDLPGTYRILEEGMTYKPGSMPLRDAQFMEIRQFQVTEVARIFCIPPHKLGDLTHATFSNIEEQNISYVIDTLRRWLVRWEQECNRKLIAPLEKSQQFTEHLVDGLLRGNIQSRYSAYAQGLNNAILSPNDIRKIENMDPYEGGDTYLVQGAMVPIDRLDDLIDDRISRSAVVESVDGEVVPPKQLPAPDDGEADRVAKLAADLRAESRGQMLGVLAAKLARREIAQLRKRVADPTAAVERLEKFYRRFVTEGAGELAPWIVRPIPVMTECAGRAMAACVAAVQSGTLPHLLAIWEADRPATWRRVLAEASRVEGE